MSKKTSGKKHISKLKDDDLFGDFKELDEFIDSDSFEVISENTHTPGTFEISSKDKKKKAGHAKPPEEKKIKNTAEDELFGDFKSLEEFERSDSYEVTKQQSETEITPQSQIEKQGAPKRDFKDDDLFGDFKSLEEFEISDSFEVTKDNSGPGLRSPSKQDTGPIGDGEIDPDNPPQPVSSFALKKAQQAAQETEKPVVPVDPAKQKLAEIAEKRRKKKNRDGDDLFSDLDDFDLESDD